MLKEKITKSIYYLLLLLIIFPLFTLNPVSKIDFEGYAKVARVLRIPNMSMFTASAHIKYQLTEIKIFEDVEGDHVTIWSSSERYSLLGIAQTSKFISMFNAFGFISNLDEISSNDLLQVPKFPTIEVVTNTRYRVVENHLINLDTLGEVAAKLCQGKSKLNVRINFEARYKNILNDKEIIKKGLLHERSCKI